jgi:hypothetical protein
MKKFIKDHFHGWCYIDNGDTYDVIPSISIMVSKTQLSFMFNFVKLFLGITISFKPFED